MPTCPIGHDSADDEFCDVCGRAMGGPGPAASEKSGIPREPREPEEQEPGEAPSGDAACAACGAALAGRFCEVCGQDSLAAPPVSPSVSQEPEPFSPTPAPAPATWSVRVSADRAYYDTVMAANGPDAASIAFPPFCPDRHFTLRGGQVSIGRHSRSRGIAPDIDLTGPPEDPGVSHLHAVLVADPDGQWSIVDLDSANGTTVNDERPLRPGKPRPLADSDRVYLGAWTKLTLRAD